MVSMTSALADRLIRHGLPVLLETHLGYRFAGVLISRSRTTVTVRIDNRLGVFERAKLTIRST